MAEIAFDIPSRIIEVLDPTPNAKVDITIQELYDACRDFEDSPQMMGFGDIAFGSGKVDLGGGTSTVVTLQLLNGWRVKFEDHTGPEVVLHAISGGNLVGRVGDQNSATQDPIAPSPFVAVQIAQATTGALLSPEEVALIRHFILGRNELLEQLDDNFILYDADTDAAIWQQTVRDKDGNIISLPEGAPAQRSQATPPP